MRGVRVFPVLINGAAMPRAGDLPDGLKKLARRQYVELSHSRFNSDVERLPSTLSSILDERRQPDPTQAERAVREGREKRDAAKTEKTELLWQSAGAKLAKLLKVAASRGNAVDSVRAGRLL